MTYTHTLNLQIKLKKDFKNIALSFAQIAVMQYIALYSLIAY